MVSASSRKCPNECAVTFIVLAILLPFLFLLFPEIYTNGVMKFLKPDNHHFSSAASPTTDDSTRFGTRGILVLSGLYVRLGPTQARPLRCFMAIHV